MLKTSRLPPNAFTTSDLLTTPNHAKASCVQDPVQTDVQQKKAKVIDEPLKRPRIGFFKPTRSWTVDPPRRTHTPAVSKTMSMTQKVAAPGDIPPSSQSSNDEIHEGVTQKRNHDPPFSPNMPSLPARQQETPLKKTEITAPRSSKRQRPGASHDYIEDEVLATPRYNLRHTPSSLRSTARSPRSLLRPPNSTNKSNYGSDLSSDFFDGVGDAFKL